MAKVRKAPARMTLLSSPAEAENEARRILPDQLKRDAETAALGPAPTVDESLAAGFVLTVYGSEEWDETIFRELDGKSFREKLARLSAKALPLLHRARNLQLEEDGKIDALASDLYEYMRKVEHVSSIPDNRLGEALTDLLSMTHSEHDSMIRCDHRPSMTNVEKAVEDFLKRKNNADHESSRQTIGVSWLDAAMRINQGEPEPANQTKKRWVNMRCEKPKPIGKFGKQTLAFAPSAISAWIAKNDPDFSGYGITQAALTQALTSTAREVSKPKAK